MNENAFQAPAVEVQRRTPEVLQRIEERCAGLLPRVEAKMKTLSGRDRRPEARLVDQAAQAGTVAKRVMWLRKAADYLQEGAAHLAACRKGCSHCCHISVMVSRAEAQVIARETGAHLNTDAGQFTMQGFEEQSETIRAATLQAYGAACTFLREGSCSIYSSRPLQCRLLLNMDDDDLLCQLIENGDSNVPYLNTTEHHIASVTVLGGSPGLRRLAQLVSEWPRLIDLEGTLLSGVRLAMVSWPRQQCVPLEIHLLPIDVLRPRYLRSREEHTVYCFFP